jgi:hypothetical protein
MLNLSLAERTIPPATDAIKKYQKRSEYIRNERININPINDPMPAECSEIFHFRFTRVRKRETMNTEIIKTFRKPGIGNLIKIYDEVA